jgi:hypothetical protein
MTEAEIENIKKKLRWTVTFDDFYSRYFIVIGPLAIIFIGTVAALSAFRNDVINLKVASICILSYFWTN